MVYVEQMTSVLYLDREEVGFYAAVMERLSSQAHSPDRTLELLDEIRRDIEGQDIYKTPMRNVAGYAAAPRR